MNSRDEADAPGCCGLIQAALDPVRLAGQTSGYLSPLARP
jgi:hypothetical protein